MISSWRAIFSGKGGRKRRAAMVSDWLQERGTLVNFFKKKLKYHNSFLIYYLFR